MGGGGPSDGRDAAPDSSQPSADAAQDPRDAGSDSSSGGDECGFPIPVCLGGHCPAFDPWEGTSVELEAEGALALQDGAAEGELRLVFLAPCEEEGLSTRWYSVTLTGSLDGVTLDARAAGDFC